MIQYCRYCAFCYYGDIPYCVKKQMTMSEEKIKRLNNCKYFIFNEMDVLNPDHIYKPRTRKELCRTNIQTDIFEFIKNRSKK